MGVHAHCTSLIVAGRRWLILAAAGGGSRFGAGVPKQYADLAGSPMIIRTLERLTSLHAAATLVALAPDDREFARVVGARSGCEALYRGGATRGETVRNALGALSARCDPTDWIVIHDAARPCVPRDDLVRLVRELEGESAGGLLAIPLSDTLKRGPVSNEAARVVRTEDRRGLWLAQTPQMFRFGVLHAAYARGGALDCTDDAQAVELLADTGACPMPRLVHGSRANIKVTYRDDLVLAAAILASQGAS